ncbi:MAG TPA: molybdopterin molybdotransferase MoeA, partial [Planctomycetaceae bacterium]
MLTVLEAIAEILAHVTPLPVARVPLADAMGLVLAEEAVCDLDSPPFDKALMDGFAVRTADLVDGRGTLHVIEEIMAGQVAQRSVASGQAIRIMTGAPLPQGADAVVPVEHTRQEQSGSPRDEVVIDSASIAPGKNIFKRGESTRRGDRVVPAGRQLRAQEIGALAELGKAEIAVFSRPRVAVLATGDELVPVGSVPGPGQIRNSNEVMLTAQLRQMGAVPHPLGVARDERGDLREKISQGLAFDILLLSGGVSAGKLDLVPSVLAETGVRQVFHKVRVKPGQPVWFGVLEAASSGKTGSAAAPCHV